MTAETPRMGTAAQVPPRAFDRVPRGTVADSIAP